MKLIHCMLNIQREWGRSMEEFHSYLLKQVQSKKYFQWENGLQYELNNDPVLQHALSTITGVAYDKFGLALAPLSLMFSTIQHVDITRPVWVKQASDLIENVETPLNSAQQ